MDAAHDAVFDRAERRAAWKVRLADELLRYVVVTMLLVLLARPVGVIVGVVWGLGIVRRLYHGELAPKLRHRWLRRELARHGRAPRSRCGRDGDGPPARRERADERLARRMGDDPRAGSAVDWARTALAELEDAPRPARGGGGVVSLADLVEAAVDRFEDEAARDGIGFRVEIDADGYVAGDRGRLAAVLRDLLGGSVRALRRGARGRPEITIEMGEDLAGSAAWVRIRDPRREAAPGADGARGVYGSRPVPGVPGATLEIQASPGRGVERILTVPKARTAPRTGGCAGGENAA